MTSQYACWGLDRSANHPYNKGRRAPPPMATMRKEEPIGVKRPRPWIARGQIEGQTSELARPRRTIKATDTRPWVERAASAKARPRVAQIFSVRVGERYFGIRRMPSR